MILKHKRYKNECADIINCDILLIGDSIIQQLALTKFYDEYLQKGIHFYSICWYEYLRLCLHFLGKSVYNAGIGGDLIENVIWRIEDGDWIEKLNPKVVCII